MYRLKYRVLGPVAEEEERKETKKATTTDVLWANNQVE